MLNKCNPDGQGPSPTNNLVAVNDGSVLQAAEEYRRQGYRVTPLEGKSPIFKDWTTKAIKDGELSRLFSEGARCFSVQASP